MSFFNRYWGKEQVKYTNQMNLERYGKQWFGGQVRIRRGQSKAVSLGSRGYHAFLNTYMRHERRCGEEEGPPALQGHVIRHWLHGAAPHFQYDPACSLALSQIQQ